MLFYHGANRLFFTRWLPVGRRRWWQVGRIDRSSAAHADDVWTEAKVEVWLLRSVRVPLHASWSFSRERQALRCADLILRRKSRTLRSWQLEY